MNQTEEKQQKHCRRRKGQVGVVKDRNNLKISLPRALFEGQQRFISLQMRDTPENRIIAQIKAGEIALDIQKNNFDFSLERYKAKNRSPQSARQDCSKQDYSFATLYQTYIESKKDSIRPGTWKGYQLNLRRIQSSPYSEVNIEKISKSEIHDWVIRITTPDSARRLAVEINACVNWAIARGLIQLSQSPFAGLPGEIRRTHKRRMQSTEINPFSRKERDLIILGFDGLHYSLYVRFCFYTGCRPSEAIGLTWEDVASDFSRITFRKVVVQGVGGKLHHCPGLKTQKQRIFPCNQQVTAILLEASSSFSSNYVFPNSGGGPIDQHNFTNRHWKPTLKKMGVVHRKFYNTRHTFITSCLQNGIEVKDVARLVGNSPQIIYEHYAGVQPNIEVPIFD